MGVIIKRSQIVDISVSGTVIEVDDKCIKLTDDKNNITEFKFDVFEEFNGKEISIKVKNKLDF